ncbi:hypothetical protein GCM10008929_03390 [Alkalibacterium psychrotolerans]
MKIHRKTTELAWKLLWGIEYSKPFSALRSRGWFIPYADKAIKIGGTATTNAL